MRKISMFAGFEENIALLLQEQKKLSYLIMWAIFKY